jgi:Leucine-rich repeat (LRR) protein
MDLGNNSLVGGIPTHFGTLNRLETLLLGRNQLTESVLDGGKVCNLRTSGVLSVFEMDCKSALTCECCTLCVDEFPSAVPSSQPSATPLMAPSSSPTVSSKPSTSPSDVPSLQPSRACEKTGTQGVAIEAIYNAFTSTGSLTNWDMDNACFCEDEWAGITCVAGVIVDLNLTGLSLAGSLATQVGLLTGLTSLNVSNNALDKSIPSELSSLAALTSLNMSTNSFTGAIPSSLGNLNALVTFNLASNSLTSSLPTELGNLGNKSLETFNVSDNVLSGTIPSEFQSFGSSYQDFTTLDLSNNNLGTSIVWSELVFYANNQDAVINLCGNGFLNSMDSTTCDVFNGYVTSNNLTLYSNSCGCSNSACTACP